MEFILREKFLVAAQNILRAAKKAEERLPVASRWEAREKSTARLVYVGFSCADGRIVRWRVEVSATDNPSLFRVRVFERVLED